MADRTVIITVEAGGTLSVSADPFFVKPNDTLCFKCIHGEFAVLFDNDRSPFANGKKAHAAHKGESTAKLKIRGVSVSESRYPVGDRVSGPSFKYAVAVLVQGTGVLTLDPDVIIDDPSGGR